MAGKNQDQPETPSRKLSDFFNPKEPIPPGLYLLLGLSSFLFFLIIWSALTYGGFIDPLFLPSPGRVFQAGVDLFLEFSFTTDILNSAYRVMAGFILAAVIGVPLGLLMGTFQVAEALTEPLVGLDRKSTRLNSSH